MEAWKLELYYNNDELYHYGTKGMKWGTRHWQNPDGTFNEAGKQRYFSKGSGENYKSVVKSKKQAYKKAYKDYSKTATAMSNKSLSISKKRRAEASEMAGDVVKKAYKAEKAHQAYKEAKAAYKADKQANKKQLTPEQKQKITKAAVGALAAAAVVGGTVYLAKTGKLNGAADAGKSLINKGKESASAIISKAHEINDTAYAKARENFESKFGSIDRTISKAHEINDTAYSKAREKFESKFGSIDRTISKAHEINDDAFARARAELDSKFKKIESLPDMSNWDESRLNKIKESTRKLVDEDYDRHWNDPKVLRYSYTVDGYTRSFDKTKG